MSMGAACLLSQLAIREAARNTGIVHSYADCWQERGVLLRFSLPSLLAGSLVGLVYWLCNTLLVNQPGGYNEMGIFNAANQWFAVIIFLPGVLGQVLLPILSESMNSQNSQSSRKVLILSLKINAITTIPLILVASILSPWIMAAYGPSFAAAWPVLIIVLVTSGILALLAPIGQIIVAGGRIWTGFAMNLGWAVVYIGMTYLMIDRGASGLAAARLFAYFVHAAWTIAYAVSMYRYGVKEQAQIPI
jgi:O-antigen/teichoic acid export membrane protein